MILLSLLLAAGLIEAQDANVSVLADFELDELFEGRDQFNNAIGHAPWGDIAGNVALSLAEAGGVDGSSTALAIDYDIGAWGGFTHVLTDGANWISQDWRAFNALRFWLSGNNTAGLSRSRSLTIAIPTSRAIAPNAGTTASPMIMRAGKNSRSSFAAFSGVPIGSPAARPMTAWAWTRYRAWHSVSPPARDRRPPTLMMCGWVTLDVQPLMLADFEMDALFIGADAEGNNIGFVPWGDTPGNVELSLFTAKRGGRNPGR